MRLWGGKLCRSTSINQLTNAKTLLPLENIQLQLKNTACSSYIPLEMDWEPIFSSPCTRSGQFDDSDGAYTCSSTLSSHIVRTKLNGGKTSWDFTWVYTLLCIFSHMTTHVLVIAGKDSDSYQRVKSLILEKLNER